MKLKNTLIISSYVLLVALLFSGSYVLGRSTVRRGAPEPTAEPAAETVETVTEDEVKAPFYEVVMEDGKLIIYKCIGNTKSVVASEEVSESIFPKDDVKELKKGVKFDRLYGAQQMFENFVS